MNTIAYSVQAFAVTYGQEVMTKNVYENAPSDKGSPFQKLTTTRLRWASIIKFTAAAMHAPPATDFCSLFTLESFALCHYHLPRDIGHGGAGTLKAGFISSFVQGCASEIAPVVAILGGMLVIIVMGEREQPLQNFLVFDGEGTSIPIKYHVVCLQSQSRRLTLEILADDMSHR